MTIEELKVLISAETSGLKREINNVKNQMIGLNKSVEKSTAGITKAFKTLKVAIIALGIGKVIKDSIMSGMEAIESENLFEVSMGRMADSARKWSNELQKTLGLNAYEIRKNLGVLYNMTTSMGLTEDSAYDLSTSLTKLAYDMASFYNLSPEEAFNKIRAGITGETEPLKALGILVDENTIKQVAYRNGIAAVGAELTQQQKVMARYMAIMEQTKNAQGDLARTIDSPANQLRILRTQLELLKINLGKAFMPIVQVVLPILTTLAKWLVTVTNLIAQFTHALFGVSKTQAQQANTAVKAAKSQIQVGKAIEEAGEKAKGSVAGFDEINQMQEQTSDNAGDIGAIEIGGGQSEGEFAFNEEGITDTETRVQEFADNVKQIFADMWAEIKGYGSRISEAFSGVKPALQPLIDVNEPIKQSFSEIGKTAIRLKKQFFKPLADYLLLEFIPSITTTFTEVFAPVFANIITGAIDTFSKTFKNVTTEVTGLLNNTWIPSLDRLKQAYAENLPQIGQALQSLLDNTIKPFVDYILNEFILPISREIDETFVPIFTDIAVAAFEQYADTFSWAANMINDTWATVIRPVFELIKDVVLDTLKTVKRLWDRYGNELLTNIQDFIQGVQDTFQKLWDNVLKPIIEPFLEMLSWLWDKHISKMVEKIGEFVFKAINGALELYNGFIKPIVDWLIITLGPTVANVISFIIDVIGTIVGVISDVVSGVFEVLCGLIDFITGVFTGDWEQAWEGIKSIFKGIVESFSGIFKGVINAIIDIVNFFIRFWNRIEFKIPSIEIPFFGKVGGLSIGVPKIKEIPKLARGGIIDKPTLAMIGESGKEAVVPLENTSFVNTLATAVGNAVLAAMQVSNFNNQNSSVIEDKEIVIQLDGTKLARIILPKIDRELQRIGARPIIQTT